MWFKCCCILQLSVLNCTDSSSRGLFVMVSLRSETVCVYGGVCVCVNAGAHSWMCWRFCASETGLYKGAARSGTASSFGSSSQTSRLLQVIYHLRLSASEQRRKASGDARLHLNDNTASSDCLPEVSVF